MFDGVEIWARIKDLFTKIPPENLAEVQFHFAHVQYWIFFALAYLGFALVSGNKVARTMNAIYVGTLAFFILVPKDSGTFSIVSWLVFGLGYLGYALMYDTKRVRSAYLLFFSLFFYWRVGAPFVYILVFSTFVDFFLGKAVYRANSDLKKKLFIAMSMVTNLGILAYFKYFKFFAVNWNTMVSQHDLPSILHITNPKENAIGMWLNGQFNGDMFLDSLPMVVGISFYTFQTMSYSIDIYRGHIKPLNNIIDFGFFVSFFPQLVAGPIVRASEFVPQINKEFKLTRDGFGWAVYMILKGLVKKMIFADFIASYFLDHVFANPTDFSGMAQLLAIFGYSLQIYGDFSGYTDMAIGIAKLMGFDLPKNFNSPYKAIHCGEFWKRWHITLSSWLKDYLYIPLGGNRGGTLGSYIVAGFIITGVLYAIDDWETTVIVCAIIATLATLSWYFKSFGNHINRNINITLTMLLGGLWHGASWQFVIWGGLNGVGVLSTKYWLRFKNVQKLLATLIVAGVVYAIKLSSGNPIWMIGVWWALTVAIVTAWKILYSVLRENKVFYAIVTNGLMLLLAGLAVLIYASFKGPLGVVIGILVATITGYMISKKLAMDKKGEQWWFSYHANAAWGMLHTLVFITFTRIYFRGETMEKIDQFYNQLWTDFRWDFGEKWLYAANKTKDFVDYSHWVFIVMGLGYLVHWIPTVYKKKIEGTFVKSSLGIQLAAVVLISILCYQAYSADAPAFIYFQF